MKIVFDVSLLLGEQKTGVQFYTYNIIEQIIKHENNEYLFNFFSLRRKKKKLQKLSPFLDKPNCRVQVCTFLNENLYNKISKIITIPYSFCFNEKPQISHFWAFQLPHYVKGKKIITVYDMVYMAYPQTMADNYKLMLESNVESSCNRADKIITISEFSKKEIINYLNINPDKIEVIPCGIDTNLFHPVQEKNTIEIVKEKYNVQGNYFLYLGTIEPRKNLVRLIQAYSIVNRKHNNIPKLVLAGGYGWKYEPIIQEVKNQRLEKEVLFINYVSNEDRVPLICGAIGFLFPSLYEGFGLPPLEAMTCGIPVLTSNISSLPEVVGDAAIKIDPLNVEEMADGIEQLLFNNELRKTLIEKGIQRSTCFSWEKSAKKLMEVYENTL